MPPGHGLAVTVVAQGVGRDAQGGHDGHAALQQGAQCPREETELDPLHEGAGQGHPKDQVAQHALARRGLGPFQRHGTQRKGGGNHEPPEATEEAADGYMQDRRQGQRLAGLVEDCGELRHHEGHHHQNHDDAQTQEHRRINHGHLRAGAQFLPLFAQSRQAVEHLHEVAPLLPRPHKIRVDRPEEIREGPEGFGEGLAVLQARAKPADDALPHRVGVPFAQGVQGGGEGQARFEQARHVRG